MRATVLAVVGLYLWGCSGQPEGSPGWLCASNGELAGICGYAEASGAEPGLKTHREAWRGTDATGNVGWLTEAKCLEHHKECVKVLRLLR